MIIDHSKIRKICIIQLQPFGDVFLTTSYLGALKEKYPEAELVFLTKAPYHKVLRDHPHIDRLFVIPKASGFAYGMERLKSFFRIWRERFDLVIDQQYMLSSQQLSLFSMARYRIGYVRERRNIAGAYNIPVPPHDGCEDIYSATAKFDIVAPLGIEYRPYKLYLQINEDEQKKVNLWVEEQLGTAPFAVISPGSTAVFKKWSAEGFAAVADFLAAKKITPVFIWGHGEEADVEKVQSFMKESSVVALPTTLQEGVALLKRAELFITNDGGINHLSVAAEIPVIALFGKTHPGKWSPASTFKTHHHFYNSDKEENDPLWGINPSDVCALAEQLLK